MGLVLGPSDPAGAPSRSLLHLSLPELLILGSVSLQKESPGLRPAFGAPWCLLIWPLPPVSSPGSNACASRPCSLLCLPKADGGRSCRCPDGVSSSVLPSGDLMCECPHGYQLKNHTCVKEGASPSSFSATSSPFDVSLMHSCLGLLKMPKIDNKTL